MNPYDSDYTKVDIHCSYCKRFIKVSYWKVRNGTTRVDHGICYDCERVLDKIKREEKNLRPRDS